MATHNFEKFRRICSQISYSMPSSYQWQWDERFQMALIVFEKEGKEPVLSVLIHEFDQQWDSTTIGHASYLVGEVVSSLSGILPGQLLFTSEAGAGLILLAAWWPWDNGNNISLRIGMFSLEEHPFDKDKRKEHLTEWLNLCQGFPQ
jgi:hypothetical protein